LAVGLLGTLPPPLHQHHHGDSTDEGAFVHIHDIDAMAEVRLLPGTSGQNHAEIRLMQENFQPLDAKSVELHLSKPGQQPVTVRAHLADDGLWQAPTIGMPTSGVWTVVVEITREGGSPLALDGPIVVGSTAKSE
jgi:hypothetical protein